MESTIINHSTSTVNNSNSMVNDIIQVIYDMPSIGPINYSAFYTRNKNYKFVINVKSQKYGIRQFPVTIDFVMRLKTMVKNIIDFENSGAHNDEVFSNGVWYYTIETKLKYFYVLYRFFYEHRNNDGQIIGGFDSRKIKGTLEKYTETNDLSSVTPQPFTIMTVSRDPTEEETNFIKSYLQNREKPTVFGILNCAEQLGYQEFIQYATNVMHGPFEAEPESDKLKRFKTWFNPLPLTKAQEAELKDEARFYKEDYDPNNDPLVKAAEQSVIDKKINEQLAARPPLPESDDEDDTNQYKQIPTNNLIIY